MNKIKNIWFNIRHFKFNSIFLRTFLFITVLTVIPFIVLSIMFYSNTLKNIREEITLENSYIFDNSVNIIDRTLMEVDTLTSSLASNESTQLYTINNVSTDSFKTISRLAKTLPIIYRYIDSIYIYSEQTDTVIMDNNSIPLSDLSDTDWINAYRAVTSPKGTIIPRSKNNVYPQLITIIKPIYVADEKKGAIIMNINAQSIYNSMLYQQYKDGRLFFLVNADNKIIISSELSYFNTYPDDIGLNTLTIESNPKNSVYEINDKNYCNGTASDYHASAGKKFDGNHFLSDDDDKYERMDSILCKSDTVSGNVCNRNFNLRSSCSHRISESAKDSDGRSLEKCRVKGGRKSGKENRKCIVEKISWNRNGCGSWTDCLQCG